MSYDMYMYAYLRYMYMWTKTLDSIPSRKELRLARAVAAAMGLEPHFQKDMSLAI